MPRPWDLGVSVFLSWVVKTQFNHGRSGCVLLCFIDPRVRKIRNEASSCPGISSRTLRFHYVASSPGSHLPHLLGGAHPINLAGPKPWNVPGRVQSLSLFLSWVSKTQLNHWTERIAISHLGPKNLCVLLCFY